MNQWINSSVQFNGREKLLTISGRGGSAHKSIVGALRELHLSPLALEDVLRQLIVEARPELAGCTLWFMDFDPQRLEWVVGVGHGSFPQVERFGTAPKEPLFRELKAGDKIGDATVLPAHEARDIFRGEIR